VRGSSEPQTRKPKGGLASHVSVVISQDGIQAARFASGPSRTISIDMSCPPPRPLSKGEILCGLAVQVRE
jgi:hypothetical protein